MSTSNPTTGLILATYPSEDPQQAIGVTYDIEVIYEDGARSVYKGISSAVQQTNADIWPARAGQPCGVHWITDNTPLFMIIEPPYFDDCPEEDVDP